MPYLPVTECYTQRVASIAYPSGYAIALPIDAVRVEVHIEGSGATHYRSGTISGSEWAYITADGITTEIFCASKPSGATLFTVCPVSGETKNLSLTVWR